MLDLLKRPSGFLPIAMSVVALSLVIGYALMFGTARQADEGAAAHLFQLLMAGQVPVILYFAIRWLTSQPKHALQVMAIQFVAGVAAFFPVWYWNW